MAHDRGESKAGAPRLLAAPAAPFYRRVIVMEAAHTFTRRPLSIRAGRKLRIVLDRAIARSSRVPNDPVLDPALFPWTEALRTDWRAIRDEARAIFTRPETVPLLAEISPDHEDIVVPGGEGEWRSFFLRGYGLDAHDNIARCPRTWAALSGVPGLNTAFFSVLTAGVHIPPHRGVTKGLLTCHLGLDVPPGPLRMAVGDRTVGWADGETLVFDDTWQHAVWNDSGARRIVLLIQFERPLAQPGKALADAFLWMVRRSAFVRDARDNVLQWHEAVRAAEAAAQVDKAA